MLRDPVGEPLDRVGNEDILGFEDPNDWISTVAAIQPGVSTNRVQGRHSVSLAAKNFVELRGRQFNLTAALPTTITLSFLQPSQATPPTFGAVQMYADCPSKGVNNAFLSQVDLIGLPINMFNTLTFTVPAAIRTAVGSSCEDFNLRVTVNVPSNATGNYLFDNIRNVAITPTTVLPEHEFEVPLDRPGSLVQHRRQRVLSAGGGSAARHARREPRRQSVLDADHRRRHQRGQRQGVAEHEREAAPLPLPDAELGQPALLHQFSLSNGMPMRIIGTDGGYKNTVQTVTQWQIGVTERVDFLVDFSNIPVGTQIVMRNTAPLFPPVGPPAGSQHRRHRHAVHRRQQPVGAAEGGPDQPGQPRPAAHARPAAAHPDPERRNGRSGPRAPGGARRSAVPRADHRAAHDRLDRGLGLRQPHAAGPQQARPPDPVPGDRAPPLRRLRATWRTGSRSTATRRSTTRRSSWRPSPTSPGRRRDRPPRRTAGRTRCSRRPTR